MASKLSLNLNCKESLPSLTNFSTTFTPFLILLESSQICHVTTADAILQSRQTFFLHQDAEQERCNIFSSYAFECVCGFSYRPFSHCVICADIFSVWDQSRYIAQMFVFLHDTVPCLCTWLQMSKFQHKHKTQTCHLLLSFIFTLLNKPNHQLMFLSATFVNFTVQKFLFICSI